MRKEDESEGAFFNACVVGDLSVVRKCIRNGMDPNLVFQGASGLWWSSQEGHKDIVKELILSGADVSFSSENGFTPLHQAIGEGHLEVAELLINSGAQLDSKTDDGSTPLHTACAYGKPDAVKLLLSYNAASIVDEDGKLPSDYARMYEHKDVLELFEV